MLLQTLKKHRVHRAIAHLFVVAIVSLQSWHPLYAIVLEIPLSIDPETELPIVTVTLNDTIELRCVADTAAGFALILPSSLCEEYGLQYDPPDTTVEERTRMLEEEGKAGVLSAKSTLGPYLIPREALVVDLPHLFDPDYAPFQAVLGQKTYRKFCVTYDFHASLIRIDTQRRLTIDSVDDRSTFALISHISSSQPTIEITIGNQTVNCIVDTGSSAAITIPASIASTLDFYTSPQPTALSKSSAGVAVVSGARLKGNVVIGNHMIEEPVIVIRPGPALIGMGVLKNFAITIDPQTNVIQLSRDSDAPVRIAPVFGLGIHIVEDDAGTKQIDFVSDRLTDQGIDIQAGDVIESVNGETSASLTIRQIRDKINADGGALLQMIRGQQKQSLNLQRTLLIP